MRTPLAMTAAKDIALFMVAPIIGLAYAMFFPFVALGLLVWITGKALAQYKVVQLVAAPFIGLAMIVLMPVIGIATLVWIGCTRATPETPSAAPYAATFPLAA